jgi:hypothetical protein
MYSVLLLVLAVTALGITLWTFREWQVTRSGLILFVLLPLPALPYELFVVGIGRWLGKGQTLLELSGMPIFWWTLTLPLALFSVATLGRRVGFAWAQIDWGHGAVCIGAVVLLLWKLPTIFTIKQLHPACWQDTVRYLPSVLATQACDAGQAGISPVVLVPLSLWVVFGAFALTGIGLWQRERWPWLALLLVSALVLLGVPAAAMGPIPAYFGKTLGFAGIAMAAVRYGRRFTISQGNIIPK